MTETLNREYFTDGLPLSIVNCQLSTPNHAISFDADTIANALVNIYQKKYGNGRELEPTLFEKTKEILGGAVNKGWNAGGSPATDKNSAFIDALRHNTDVFSAFRTHKMQSDIAAQLLDSKGRLKPFGQFVKDVKPYVTHQNRAWLQTEYDTAVLRAHQAADWKQFEAEKDVLPNLEWLPSTSPHPGEDHRPYWGTVLPIDHKFWNEHRPGDRWNCKCRLRNTDKEPTAAPAETVVKNLQPSKGLESNPGKTGEIFSNNHPYYPENCGKCPFNKGVGRLFAALVGGKKHCEDCHKMNFIVTKPKSIFTESAKRIEPPQKQEYEKVYEDVFKHPLHGENEYRANLQTAIFLKEKMKVPVWILPRLNSNTEQDLNMRNRLLPFAKPKKNPDFLIGGRTFDAKDMFNIEAKEKESVINSIKNHIKSAKMQADNVILRIPKWVKRSWINNAVKGFFGTVKPR